MILLAVLLTACASSDDTSETTSETEADIESVAESGDDGMDYFTEDSTVGEVIQDEAFGEYGRLLFPVDLSIPEDITLREVSTSQIYLWYTDIQPEETVDILNSLKEQSLAGNQIFYPIYSEEEIASDPSKADTGLFFFRGDPGKEFAITNAGGGFYYVGAMHDSFPHALELSRDGYNAFALIYRPADPYEDLAQAITYIYDHAEELQVDPQNYSLWGGSAGARMAAVLGNADYLRQLTGREDIPQAAAVIMQYTGYTEASEQDAPTYANVGNQDGIANWKTMEQRLDTLESIGISTEFHMYEGLRHGFGLGTGTVAEGWITDAVTFWERQMESEDLQQNQTEYTTFVPDTYFEEASRQGSIEQVTYQSRDYTSNDKTEIEKTAYVYLPYGYDADNEEQKFDILYLMHGWTMTAEDYFYAEESNIVNMLDNMIENGDIEPVIVVSATFDVENQPQNFSRSVDEIAEFYQDFRNDLTIYVESHYHTYAEGTTEEDFRNSREHRAFGGFSLGAVTTWYQFVYNLDYIKYFLPMSGDCWILGTYGGLYYPEETTEYLENVVNDGNWSETDFYIYEGIGTSDPIWNQVDSQIQAMFQSSVFTEQNLHYAIKEDGHHDVDACEEYLYHALLVFFGTE